MRAIPGISSRSAGASLLVAALAFLLACGNRAEPPNLVLIIADDQSWIDFGFMGAPNVRTPNLDRLAEEGTVFTHGYNTASICRPSLRSILTGLDPRQLNHELARLREAGIRRSAAKGIADFETLPRILSEHGYKSFEGGKFWEADYRVAGFTHGMQKPGDDPAHGGVGRWLGRETMTPLSDFLDEHGETPFLLWFAPQLPHYPHDPPARYRKAYEGRSINAPTVLYYGNIARLDEVVGELVADLDERGLRERTLIVFLSDNGWDQQPDEAHPGYHAGPRGKMTMYELGFRTPIIFNWSGKIAAGVRKDELVSTLDLFPSLLDYAGAPVPDNRPGRSLRPLMEGTEAWNRDAVIGHMENVLLPAEIADVPPTPGRRGHSGSFLRTARWRYVWYEEVDRHALYDIEVDPRESVNLAASHPALVVGFRDRIEQWKREMARPFSATPEHAFVAEP